MKKTLSFPEFGQLEFENGILTVRLTEGLEITEQILKTIFIEEEKFVGDSKYCIIADLRHNISSTSEARKFGAKNSFSKNHLAYALLADTMAVIILANFFIRVNKPNIPTRLFKKEEDAIQWLQSFL